MNAPSKAMELKAAISAVLAGMTAFWGWTGWLVIVWLITMILDYATGSWAALSTGTWDSAVARAGLWHKLGSIVAIEPSTGEVLCMVSSPTYDPRMMVGRQRGKNHLALSRNPLKPLLNRSIMGQYPPGSTFKTTQALTFLQEGIITPETAYPCYHGFIYRGLKVGCHGHAAPAKLVPAIGTSCNAYFCWGLYYMFGNRTKYKNVQ